MTGELPVALAEALDNALADVSPQDLQRASARLSERYREGRPRGPVARTDADVLAYAATRLPATFAAVSAALEAVRDQRPGWEPRSMLDVGAGPGTGLWAAAATWPSLTTATAKTLQWRFVCRR